MKWHEKLANKLLMLIVGALALMFITAEISLVSVHGSVNDYKYLLDHKITEVTEIDAITIAFKGQVQEWKNVLLRGYDEKQRTKYWGKFQKSEVKIREKAEGLVPKLEAGYGKEELESFIARHRTMGEAYRKGYEAFVAAGFDSKVGDKAVKGIDRAPTKELQKASEKILTASKSRAVDLDAVASKSYYVTLIAFSIIVFSIALAAHVITKRMVIRPMHKIMDDLNHLSEGHLNHKVSYKASNELGEIADAARKLQMQLQSMITDVKETSEIVADAAQSFTEKSESIAQHTEDQHIKTDQVATAMQEMSSTAGEVSGHAQSAADNAESADNTATNGCKVMNDTIHQMGRLADEVTNAGTVINNLQEKTNAIGSVLDVIKNIAEQTNLLALNAAIEAARAGEQGRGFAVVADEVRTLAQRTQSSTAEIQEIIEAVQEGAGKAVSAMEVSQTHSTSCVEMVDSAGSMLQEIQGSIGQIKDMNMQIATAAEEQTLVAKDISENIENIAHSSDVTNEQSKEIAHSSMSLSDNAAKLQQTLRHFTV